MEQLVYSDNRVDNLPTDQSLQITTDVKQVPNAVLDRLINEVKNDQANDMFAYNRSHNRHNRS